MIKEFLYDLAVTLNAMAFKCNNFSVKISSIVNVVPLELL